MNRRELLLLTLAILGSPRILLAETNKEKWEKLSPAEKEVLRKRWLNFKNLDPDKRKRLVLAYKRFKSLPNKTQKKILSNLNKWRSVPPDKVKLLKTRFQR
ncbi:MAG: DUF3106 domain-containing protein [Bdellovibrionales bacterium]|nr:DUF3106 domain-containing protein [Bdellovibrionales bacterium]